MAITLNAQTGHTFAEPLGLLSDCHRRVEKFLGVIATVARQAAGGPLNDEQRRGLETALRYFRQAAPLHTADEEASLFPRLRAVDNPEVHEALAQIARLEADHKAVEADHQRVDEIGSRWLAEDHLPDAEAKTLRERAEALQASYAAHIALEDTVIFPLAARALEPDALSVVGREMAQRRGLDPDAPSPLSRCVQRRAERAETADRG